jgi:transposase
LRETTGGNTGTAPASLPHYLLKNPEARFTDLGYGYYQARTDVDRKLRNHIRQIQALGFDVTVTRTA